jgi:transposase
VRFLAHLLYRIPGKLLVIWDGLSAHRGKAVRAFLSTPIARERLLLERLPENAPDLNPGEGLWAYLMYVELRNHRFQVLVRLWDGLALALARVRHRRDMIRGFIKQVGYASG